MYINLQKTIDFIKIAITETKKHQQSIQDLQAKIKYQKHIKELEYAKLTLLKEFFAYEIWETTGKYEVPEIL